MKRLLLVFSLFLAIPTSAGEITSKIVDSVQMYGSLSAIRKVT